MAATLARFSAMAVDHLAWPLLDLLIKATLLLAVAWLATTLLRFRSAALRHRVWSAALAGAMLLPLFSTVLPGWRVAVLPGRFEARGSTSVVEAAEPAPPAVPRTLDKATAALAPTMPRRSAPSDGHAFRV